jgi:hypothetical protein
MERYRARALPFCAKSALTLALALLAASAAAQPARAATDPCTLGQPETVGGNSREWLLAKSPAWLEPLSQAPQPGADELRARYADAFTERVPQTPRERLATFEAELEAALEKAVLPQMIRNITTLLSNVRRTRAGELGTMRESSCLEWAMFAEHLRFQPELLTEIESAWFVLERGQELRIVMRVGDGITAEYRSILPRVRKLRGQGWTVRAFMHNHPDTHLSDSDPQLVASGTGDGGDVREFLFLLEELELRSAVITDGMDSTDYDQASLRKLAR